MTKFKKLFVVFTFVCAMASAMMLMGNASPAPLGKSGDSSGEKININTAGIDQLTKLPRIGPKIAQRIIDFRKKNGKFKRPQDLMKVKGIGEKTFQRFSKRLVVGKGKSGKSRSKGGKKTAKIE